MKNKLQLVFLCLFLISISCTTEDPTEDIESNEKMSTEINTQQELNSQIQVVDSIIPLNEEDFPKIAENSQAMVASSTWDELYQLDGVKFFLRTQDSYLGKNSLQTHGPGAEITFEPNSDSSPAQLFYLEFLPASSGIQYLLYSYQENKPIGIGAYASDPDTKVLYTSSSANPSSYFGFSWDFISSNGKGYKIENRDIIFQGSSGSFWDIYYGVITNSQGNVTLSKDNNTFYQTFNIIPDDEFTILDMDMDIDNAQIVSSEPTVLSQKSIENPSDNTGSRTITFTETQQDQYNFKESSSVSYQYTANVSAGFSLFKVIEANTSFTVTTGNSTTLEYGNSSTKTITLSDSYTIAVPPHTRSLCSFRAMKHSVRVPYTATLKGLEHQSLVTITGFFEAVDYTTSTLRVDNYPLNSISQQSQSSTPTNTIYIEADN
tara:strand:- start:1209 stop:2507 length:1299 start_codon:yes stop_codon:yes gene_type:complete